MKNEKLGFSIDYAVKIFFIMLINIFSHLTFWNEKKNNNLENEK